MLQRYSLVLSCEHGGCELPPGYEPLFQDHQELLHSHRGWDPGALELARTIARTTGAPLYTTTVSRLLVEMNRSRGNPALFSAQSWALDDASREELALDFHDGYWNRVAAEVDALLTRGQTVVHLAVHTFTPELDGEVRQTEIGLLYDPVRMGETELCLRWEELLHTARPDLRITHNYPYSGTADGVVTALRADRLDRQYVGVEIEVNQAFALGLKPGWEVMQQDIAETVVKLLAG